MKKYEFTGEVKALGFTTLYRIKAVRSFAGIKVGDIGGWIEKESNLSHHGNAWVCGDARVCGYAWVRRKQDILVIGPIGSRDDYTTFYKSRHGISVKCGCFEGTINAFLDKVKRRHGTNHHAKMYQSAVELARMQMICDENS